ncbi:hypothetical protein NBN67_19650 [Clostridioides difficile]|uniref:hypothetical protein n=1 Tax=Clostridioides difficile TaxID=1496 RepID=UPI00202F7304|nr:hypothetical protein [Clostridioides difficile]MCM0739752.1 hypothetical protein [Clostridioides difficile]MDW0076955.1 hypothetical protein [Clostridioides difficile]HBF2930453.1 hypothetical protein [Clostridioides difficile]HBF2935837.1 hypothetical protein [Clostridioides difficile]HBZ0282632.1 hypothetical protein [Clostridioides difficile]
MSSEYNKGKVIIFLACIIFGLLTYFSIQIEKGLEIKERKAEKIYKLDYKLEDEVIKAIETDKIVNLEKLAKIKFSKIGVYPSYSSTKDLKSFIKKYNDTIPKDYFNYIVFLDKNEEPVKVMVLNKKYDILENRNYKEYLKKNTTFKFNKVNKNNEIVYNLCKY